MIAPIEPEALVLDTPRLSLRPWADEDEDLCVALLCDPQVMRFVGETLTEAQARAHMANARRRGAGGRLGIWCVQDRATGEKIGDGVLTPIPIETEEPDWAQLVPDTYPEAAIEVGYLLKPGAWGQGFATEICARLLRFAFEQTALAQVVACTDPDNSASQHVLRKCRLRDCGPARAYASDVAWFEMTRAEWQAQASNQ
ncbi:GNAT family N-acetyltransferase [Roseovarius sp. BRH_c41]|jgi:ribosomal-protein-alanine N-acetyltransferase|uniref:GNAT family N-acetyltransferase n=1 Tax=Roseovarius sp. BRH_c41 TaxID=1629709 RepID=UPI000B282C15|nr:GNAT family N-acetyltransferase [Roseovarius sp. BRH_c41]